MRLNDSNLTGSFAIVQRGFKHLSEVMRSFLKALDFHVKNRDFSKKNKTLLCNKRHLFYISEKGCCIIIRQVGDKKLQGEKVSQTGGEGVLLLL